MLRRLLLGLLLGCSACVGPEDTPGQVVDLRVLGISIEPPELLTTALNPATQEIDMERAIAELSVPLEIRALLADPKGEGREISWVLSACAWPGDRRCAEEANRVALASGKTQPGELVVTARPGVAVAEDGVPLLQKVFEQDLYRGLGGLRMPLVLRVSAGEELIHAQKLMVFTVPLVAGMEANVNPVLPGLIRDDQAWPAGELPTLTGEGPFRLTPEDFSALEERYVVPTFELEPLPLEESWQLSWHVDYGRLSPEETGGTNLAGVEGRHRVEWTPPARERERRNVNLWVVARDGRGGTTWLTRTFVYEP